MTHTVNVRVDACGLDCPMPLLKMKLALNRLAVGESVELQATDPGSVKDIRSFCDISGHLLLEFVEAGGRYCYIIEKSH